MDTTIYLELWVVGKADSTAYLPMIVRKSTVTVVKAALQSKLIFVFFILNPCPAEPGYTLPLQTV